MLSLANVSAGMAFNYFSKDDYYAPKDHHVEVVGALCEDLGIKESLSNQEFSHLLDGHSLDGSVSLVSEKLRFLKKNEVENAFSSFEKNLEKTTLSPEKRSFLYEAFKEKLDSKKTKGQFKSLGTRERKSLQALIKIFCIRSGLGSKDQKIVSRGAKSLLKVISPETRRSATDMTFSAPKSVSILGLVGNQKEIIDCHKEAVSYALKHIEKEYIGTRITKDRKTSFENTGKMVCAKFLHINSREGDPQLHTHCVLFNLTKSRAKKWVATAMHDIYQDSKLLGVIYQNKLAELVQSKGYAIELTENGTIEIKGFSDKHLKLFSKRRQQVLDEGAKFLYEREQQDSNGSQSSFEELKEGLISNVSQKLARISVYRSRKSKSEASMKGYKERWFREANENNLVCPEKTHKSLWGKPLDLISPLRHISERKAIFQTKEVELQALIENLGRASDKTIRSSVCETPEFVLANSKKELATDIEQLKLERDLIQLVKNQEHFSAIGSEYSANTIAHERSYSSGQKNALTLSLTSTDQFMLWNGVAGAGKSYVLGDLKKAAEKKKIQVFALAPDGGSARELGKSIGADSSTVQRFLLRKEDLNQALLIVDEATKLSTKLMVDLVHQAQETNSRILFVGDRRQFTAVEAGNPFETLYQSIHKTELTEHLRQEKNSIVKEAVEQASKQNPESLVSSSKILESNIIERKSQKARQAQFIHSYLELSQRERKSTLLLVDLNHDRRLVTETLRSELQKEGSLSKSEVLLPILVAKDLTRAQKTKSYSYNQGEYVVSYGSSSNLQSGVLYEIIGIENETLQLSANGKITNQDLDTFLGSVYRKESIPVSKGDLLEWRKNQGERLNRDSLTVIDTESDSITVKDQAGTDLKIPLSEPQHLDYALVKTAYSVQGATSDRVIALSTARSSMQSWYVTLSRAKKDVKIITDFKDKLVKNILKSSKQVNALDHSTKKELEPFFRNEERASKKSFQLPQIRQDRTVEPAERTPQKTFQVPQKRQDRTLGIDI